MLILRRCFPCQVSIYGFDQAATHYYHKKPSTTTKPFEQRHGWGAEHHCSAQYEQRYDAFRSVPPHPKRHPSLPCGQSSMRIVQAIAESKPLASIGIAITQAQRPIARNQSCMKCRDAASPGIHPT